MLKSRFSTIREQCVGRVAHLFASAALISSPIAGFSEEPPAQVNLKISSALSAAAPADSPTEDSKVAATVSAQAAASYVPSSTQLRDYRIGAEDLLEVQVFGIDQLARTVRVNSRGLISLPLIGAVQVGGLTAQEAEASITVKLGDTYLQNPQVSLFIKEYTSQRITIEGAVNKPGIYPLRGNSTLIQALALAGGQGSLSDMKEVMLFRQDSAGKRIAQVFDVDRIRSGELEDPKILNDDIIVVKREKNRTILKDSILRDLVDFVNPFK